MNLKDLSKLLNLSQTTVSRALNGYPEVGAATRERVLAAAAQYNYTPNPRAKGLATGRANAIGHVISVSNRGETLNPIFGDFITGANDVYMRRGFDMMLSFVDDKNLAEGFDALKARGTVDGVVLHSPKPHDPRLKVLNEAGLPFVVHGRVLGTSESYSWVDVKNRTGFRRATDHLVDLGHTRIALVNGREELEFAASRRTGFEEGLAAVGLSPDPALMSSDEMTEAAGNAAASRMLDSGRPPTAFLASSMMLAWGVRRAAEARGLRIGQDISIVTFDDDLYYMANEGDPPEFTAIRSSVRAAGSLAAEILMRQINTPDAEPEHHLLEPELILGASTAPPKAS